MNSLFGIIFKTEPTFQKLYDEFSDDLNIKTTIIFYISGVCVGIRSIVDGWYYDFNPSIWQLILILFLSGLINILLGRYIISLILYKLGKFLNGKADFIDIVVVTSYSLIPTWLEVPLDIYKATLLNFNINTWQLWILNSIHLIIWCLSIKILIQGIKNYNQFGIMKAFLNISPIILTSVIFILILINTY